MGALRLFLALCVAFSHIRLSILIPAGKDINDNMIFGMNAGYAVMMFYVISGFLISFVLDTKYPPDLGGARRFYQSRFIRIYSLYWPLLLFAALVYGTSYAMHPILDGLPALFILGSDWRVGFADYPNQYFGLFPTGLNPAWSLGVELTFYLMAPFMLRSKTTVFFVFLLSIMTRAALCHVFGFKEAWTYTFFPSTLCFFLMGYFSYHFYKQHRFPHQMGIILLALAFSILFFSCRKNMLTPFDNVYFYSALICFTLAVPPLFAMTKDNFFFNMLGDISYPVYLTHVFSILWFGKYYLPIAQGLISAQYPQYIPYMAMIVAFAGAATLAVFAHVIIERPCAYLLRKIAGKLNDTH